MNNRLEKIMAIKGISNRMITNEIDRYMISVWGASTLAEAITTATGVDNIRVRMTTHDTHIYIDYNGNKPSNRENETWRSHEVNIYHPRYLGWYHPRYNENESALDISWFGSRCDLTDPRYSHYVAYLKVVAYIAEEMSNTNSLMFKHHKTAVDRMAKLEKEYYALSESRRSIEREIYEDIKEDIKKGIEGAIKDKETVSIKPYVHKGDTAVKMKVLRETEKFITFSLISNDDKVITKMRRNIDNFKKFANDVWAKSYNEMKESVNEIIKNFAYS